MAYIMTIKVRMPRPFDHEDIADAEQHLQEWADEQSSDDDDENEDGE